MFVFKHDKIPSKITPCHIKDVASELRYSDNVPLEVIVGLLYNSFKNIEKYSCKMPQRLPINDLPINVRLNDPNLKYQAHYLIDIGNNIVIRISPYGVSIAIQGDYIGWTSYHECIKDVLSIVHSLNLIKTPDRLGLRYTSFFKNDISNDVVVNLNVANNDFMSAKNYIRSEWLHKENINCTLQVSNNVLLNENGQAINGSLIDIDIATATNNFAIASAQQLLIEFHSIEKEIFFSMLKPEFLTSLHPEYSND